MKPSTKAIVAAVVLFVAALAAWLGQPLVHDNDRAVDVVVTVFSILAGFLVAILSLVGEGVELRGSWRLAELSRKRIERRLKRHQWLFFCYLVTLALIFVSTLVGGLAPSVVVWIERAYLFFAVLTFLLSLWLPWALARMQREKVDSVIEDIRQREGIGGGRAAGDDEPGSRP